MSPYHAGDRQVRPHGTPKELEHRRKIAIKLLKEGLPPIEVAGMVGADPGSIRRWNKAYRKGGTAAIWAREAPGRPSKLNEQQKDELKRVLLQGDQECHFARDRWTFSMIA